MSFHFASTEYASCFANLPSTDPEALRHEALRYLQDDFDPRIWHDDPIVSLVRGRPLTPSDGDDHASQQVVVETFNALGQVNGKQILASESDLDTIAAHLSTYVPPPDHTDLRNPIRAIEHELLNTHAGFLIGNQLVDFAKQDGVTEIVEAVQANAVERRLNDLLLRDESLQHVVVNRKPVYVSCVSNFTNFLDLSRKTLRSLEVGIPCVVLGRTAGNTAQHSYRWVQLLSNLLEKENVDAGMLTYCSASLPDVQRLIQKCRSHTGLLYATSSRSTALSMSHTYSSGDDDDDDGSSSSISRVVASTGGPNTMVVLHSDTLASPAVQKAIQTSATIECAGQCTALRHCVVPAATTTHDPQGSHHPTDAESVVSGLWSGTPTLPDTNLEQALQNSVFDGVYVNHKGTAGPADDDPATYRRQGDAWYRVSDALPPSAAEGAPLHEYWRKVVVDFTQLDCADGAQLRSLAAWLNENQPISLAVNGPRSQALNTGLELFRTTALVVYTIGSHDDPLTPPALTCQARPQECEVFGEFPPRNSMRQYTRFPVFIPSSNPSYDTHYTSEYLLSQPPADQPGSGWTCNASTRELLLAVSNPKVRGYCILLLRYLQDVCRMNPKSGMPTMPSSRTTLWGLQRPPVGWTTILVVKDESVRWNDVAPIYLLFHATNAKSQVQLSVSPSSSSDVLAMCEAHKLPHVVEDEAERQDRLARSPKIFHVVDVAPMATFPMVDHFVSLYFPLGHIKSTRPGDDEFLLRARLSDKWLNTNF
jgi:hypothetical protein